MSIACIILFVVGTTLMVHGVIGLISRKKRKKQQNKVHFYLVKTGFMRFELFLGYPIKCNGSMDVYWTGNRVYIDMKDCGLNPDDYIDLDFDKPVEVFLNLED